MDYNRPRMNYSGEDWHALRQWLEADLLATYQRMAGLNISDQETHQLKGRASLLNQMLGFPTVNAAFEAARRTK